MVSKTKIFFQAKESWEMALSEKLEQAVLVKQKGTQYFKVRSIFNYCLKLFFTVCVAASLMHVCRTLAGPPGLIQNYCSTNCCKR